MNAVLFPEGVLSLQVVSTPIAAILLDCLANDTVCAVCLIEHEGDEARATQTYQIGTSARVLDCQALDTDRYSVLLRGERRFRIEARFLDENGYPQVTLQWQDDSSKQKITPSQAVMLPLLMAVAADAGERMPRPHRFDEASWVSARYCEILPIPPLARQRLLELDDLSSRLEIITAYLRQHGLLAVKPVPR